jgi:pimeloyl-ACP methyl ester carboxylesterase
MLVVASVVTAGCSQQRLPNRSERMTRGYIYYLDGAGGGGSIRNYSAGVKQGMLDAGYDGAGEMFDWQTGLGMLADQDASVDYKRAKAAKCAERIKHYMKTYPGVPVTVMGMSAGAAVAVFALEALPETFQVENLVLLSGSLSADYDLTRALSHVRGRMYVTTSDKDAMLLYMVPLAGTADRQPGTVPSGGLSGFDLSVHASAETRSQYAKIMYIRWNAEFTQLGDKGQHFDTVSARFVQVCVAPLIMRGGLAASSRSGESRPSSEKVMNPDYQRWSKSPVGSWIMLRGYQSIAATRQDVGIKAVLIEKQPDMLIVERQYFLEPNESGRPMRVHGFFVPAWISPEEHPLTSPTAKISDLPAETIKIAGKALDCSVRSVQATGDFSDYGRSVAATVWQNESLPGGMARVWLKSRKGDQPFEFRGDVVAYGTR